MPAPLLRRCDICIPTQPDWQATLSEQLTSVVMDSAHWYEACWNDFVIEGEHATLFLHLGVSD